MKIIVIEDEKPIRQGLMRILSKMDPDYHVVAGGETGKEGLKLLEREQPELAFLDIQMPDMDGLQMLREARRRGIEVKVVILTAYSDFKYAKEAISLGIENYLLKPVDIQELRKTMEKIRGELLLEQRGRHALTLGQLLAEALEGRLGQDGSLEAALAGTYGITAKERLYCLFVALGSHYDADKAAAEGFLRELESHGQAAKMCWIPRERKHAFLVCFHHVGNEEKFVRYVKRSVTPTFYSRIRNHGVFTWKECDGAASLAGVEAELEEAQGWNLLLGGGVLIECGKISAVRTYRFAYPAELENRARRAVIRLDCAEFVRCFQLFMESCLLEVHRPQDIREVCIRFAYAVINTAKECGALRDEELMVQKVMKTILEAVGWDEIMDVMLDLFSRIQIGQKEQSATELLVQRALSLIRECYGEGINLEETARRLHVSEEYLGKQLKKETGFAFTDLIRKQRVDQVKRFLLDTDLKLNQIASMTGFSDPKYMSKVFRAEVGMLPNEYRRMNT